MGPKSSQKASYFKVVCGLKHRNFFVEPNGGMYWPMHTLSITSFKKGLGNFLALAEKELAIAL